MSQSTLLFTTIDLLRNELAKIGPFWWMLWNALLALIPVALALVFFNRSAQPRSRLSTLIFCLQLALVLLFLPNAPYVATDLVHFLESVRKSELSLWRLLATEFPLYVAFVFLGLVSYSFTVDRILFALKKRFGWRAYFVGLFGIPILTSIGVYLGRVARFNSWDILQSPINIARSSGGAFSDLRIFKIIAAMAALLFVLHQVYRVFHDGIRARLGHLPVRDAVARKRNRTPNHAVATGSKE